MIRVLIVDDSALMRGLLTEILSTAPDIKVVGTAQDPYVARERIKALDPDVLTLDVEMPRMDGLTFLRNLMRLRPMPVVMVSSLTEEGAEVTLQALELGAVDFVCKPKGNSAGEMGIYAEDLIEKVRLAATVKPRARVGAPAPQPLTHRQPSVGAGMPSAQLLAIGASTGGTEAIKEVLLRLPPDAPGVVIAQHIPPGFSAAFARRMHQQTGLNVKEAEDGDRIRRGHAYIAPGDRHLRIKREGSYYVCQLDTSEPVNRHRPSVDVLFWSVAEVAGPKAAAALLTGMGADGADGLKRLRELGAYTIAQDEATSVVWGMPGEAVKRGAAIEILPLLAIADALLKDLETRYP
ncbi:chemotaxis response regulator protein-glutamate methylesterase [Caldichromatium japonicum]|uniref:Protein-glutamate methylesterase/protein-glutamine glutaminase n=1 Tax=Caldichromatium japonicum TaxID=2699430 RepID=A0A6G7VEE3_9GAMM|nr:chemotaxis response regulator protein-glutamate methylesterase [Caldichromatium japonicum]QIK38280.1 chemotaxis response regulator protein-glutamate methylesterase [Caldichromatium japonicum]